MSNNSKELLDKVVGPRINTLSISTISILFSLVFLILLLIFSDIYYLFNHNIGFIAFKEMLLRPEIISAMRMSTVTSLVSLLLILCFSIPIGYALSRFRFPGHTLMNTIVDIPLILPPVVIGVSLLAFFGSPLGAEIKFILKTMNISIISGIGIVLCQFFVSISYCIRATKASFDSIDRRLEHIALTLGCSQWQAFLNVAFPLSRNGVIAGAVMAWARAIGVFGPLMIFVGTGPRVQVMPTSIWLELSIGNIELSIVIALVMVFIAASALTIVHWLGPGRSWA
ncbi:MAG: ABC transporter permease [Verrucomicrobiota bacterium]|nr:ABC transporter permease [Verrucomicrobiota bacterium]